MSADVAVALIIGDDEDHIGSVCGGGPGAHQAAEAKSITKKRVQFIYRVGVEVENFFLEQIQTAPGPRQINY